MCRINRGWNYRVIFKFVLAARKANISRRSYRLLHITSVWKIPCSGLRWSDVKIPPALNKRNMFILLKKKPVVGMIIWRHYEHISLSLMLNKQNIARKMYLFVKSSRILNWCQLEEMICLGVLHFNQCHYWPISVYLRKSGPLNMGQNKFVTVLIPIRRYIPPSPSKSSHNCL